MCDAFILDEIDDLLPESFFEVYAAFVFLIETKREILRTMPGKSTGLILLLSPDYVLEAASMSLIHSIAQRYEIFCRNKGRKKAA